VPQVRVGISGWTYPPWRGNFYPDGLPQRLELAYASRRFNALEINGTFYSLQRASSFRSWYELTPPGFVFSLKGGKYLTHVTMIKEPRQPLANFLASGLLALREKLGPILWQFPPFMQFDEERFKRFFELLPRDTFALARLAKEHAPSLKGKVELETDQRRPVRHAVEFRHESFMTDRFTRLLREHNIALVIADVASKYPTAQDATADWIYVRLHGSRKLYASGYEAAEIEAWSKRIKAWRDGAEPVDARRIDNAAKPRPGGRDVFVFFDNTDVKQRAPVDARAMATILGVGPADSVQEVLEQLEVASKSDSRSAKRKGKAATAPKAKRSVKKPAPKRKAATRWPAKKTRKSG